MNKWYIIFSFILIIMIIVVIYSIQLKKIEAEKYKIASDATLNSTYIGSKTTGGFGGWINNLLNSSSVTAFGGGFGSGLGGSMGKNQ